MRQQFPSAKHAARDLGISVSKARELMRGRLPLGPVARRMFERMGKRYAIALSPVIGDMRLNRFDLYRDELRATLKEMQRELDALGGHDGDGSPP